MASSSAHTASFRRDLVLIKTYEAFQDRLEYAKAKNGSWTVEFHGRFHVHAEDPSLDRCRHRALSALDEQLAAFIAGRSAKAQTRGKVRKKD
jgi:hypothetical protein